MTHKFRPELALFSTIIKNDTTPNIDLSKISGGSGTITLEQPMGLSIEKPIGTITPISISETIDSKPSDVAASGIITKEQSKEIDQNEVEVIEQETIDIPNLIHPVIEEDIYPQITEKLNTLTEKILSDIVDRLEILENKKSFTEKVIKYVEDKIKWR